MRGTDPGKTRETTPQTQSSQKYDKPDTRPAKPPAEIGGQTGPDPTRYGDWEKNGRCTDF